MENNNDTQNATKEIFCPKEQKVTSHNCSVDKNGELLFECGTSECGTFFKLPATLTAEEVGQFFTAYEDSSKGQVDISKSQALLNDVLNPNVGI